MGERYYLKVSPSETKLRLTLIWCPAPERHQGLHSRSISSTEPHQVNLGSTLLRTIA